MNATKQEEVLSQDPGNELFDLIDSMYDRGE
jgi:hypothetical protein